jgi:hypothetical protein
MERSGKMMNSLQWIAYTLAGTGVAMLMWWSMSLIAYNFHYVTWFLKGVSRMMLHLNLRLVEGKSVADAYKNALAMRKARKVRV